jgi:hypothetical protein
MPFGCVHIPTSSCCTTTSSRLLHTRKRYSRARRLPGFLLAVIFEIVTGTSRWRTDLLSKCLLQQLQ